MPVEEKAMRRIALCVILTVFMVAAFTPLAAAQDNPEYFVSLFKDFLRDIEQKNYVKAWDSMTVASKNWIAGAVADAANKQGKNVTRSEVYTMLENDASGTRTTFFTSLNDGWTKDGFYQTIKTAKFTVKSITKDRAVVNITIENEGKDFQAWREGDRWKVNFFEDLMQN
jgi:hypothetical protein